MSTENTVTTTTEAKEVKAPKQKVQITVEQIEADLINGLNRDEIAEKYGAPRTVINRFFKHKALKGKRPKHKSMFELVVDGDVVPVNSIPVEKTVKPTTETVAGVTTEQATETLSDTVAPASGSIADRVSESTGI